MAIRSPSASASHFYKYLHIVNKLSLPLVGMLVPKYLHFIFSNGFSTNQGQIIFLINKGASSIVGTFPKYCITMLRLGTLTRIVPGHVLS